MRGFFAAVLGMFGRTPTAGSVADGSLSLFDARKGRSAAEAKAAQAAWARHLGVNVVERNSVGMDMVLIPPGRFLMGAPSDEGNRGKDEGQVEVTLTNPLFVGRTEVTQGQWKSVMRTAPWSGQSHLREGNEYPAVYVRHEETQEFCRKLGEKAGKQYRLLSEAEWEYACRAGTTTHYCFGDGAERLAEYAWYDANTMEIGDAYAHEVGMKKPNAFGLCDMHGNVLERCGDFYADRLVGGANPQVVSGDWGWAIRGGSWNYGAPQCHSAFRGGCMPSDRFVYLGFRVASVIELSAVKVTAGTHVSIS